MKYLKYYFHNKFILFGYHIIRTDYTRQIAFDIKKQYQTDFSRDYKFSEEHNISTKYSKIKRWKNNYKKY